MSRSCRELCFVVQLTWLGFMAILVPATASGVEVPRKSILVGGARIDITPGYPVRLSGYGNRRAESEGVAQPLWAKAIAIGSDEGDGSAIWISYENCGLTPAIRDRVARALQERAHVRPERIAISVTHTHTAPCLTGWAPYLFGADIPPEHQKRIDQYTEELTEKLIQVALNALSHRRPAQLSWGTGKVSFAVNRRVLADGKWTGFGEQADGPVDHRLQVLAAHDETGKLTACVANYACHCTTLGGNFNRIAGDWAGFAHAAIEADHPGAVGLITIGCGADANPTPRRDDLAVCESQGRALAAEVRRVLKGEMRPLSGPLSCKLLSIELPFDPPRTEKEWTELAAGQGVTGYHASQFLDRMKRGEKFPTHLSYPVGTWTFGDDLALVFLGGEVVVDYAIRMHAEFGSDRLWITAYTNDVPCYIPSKRILREGGYEADRSMALYARPNRLAPEVEDLVIDAVQKLLPHSFYTAGKQVDFPPPRSPAESLAAIQVLDGWQVELVAAEPLVEDPVAFDWGPDGRLWVAEMRDYPNGISWRQPGDPLGVPGGRIKILTDTDGDGRFDRADRFLDNISFPAGIKVWRKGILVTAAPSIFYAEDTDGDGIADRREDLYTGFVTGNQQHRVNGLRWGIDNWLYVANGDSGGNIRSNKSGDELSISGRDLRIRPDDGSLEAQSGQTQFGRCNDDWNNWFGGNNANPLWHYLLDDHYLRRNPHVSPPAVRRDVPEFPGTAPVFPISRTLARFNDFHTANRFTSACSPEVYRDDLLQNHLGQPGQHVFICEPVHNLVHHAVMHSDGVSFQSRRSPHEANREFFASADNWCRPVMVRTGPDGAIWIADMYRQVIEHPQWIPATWQRKLDLQAGRDRGRIYRVMPRGISRRSIPPLDRMANPERVAMLEHPNGWVRDMSQQLLLWSRDPASFPLLEELARRSRQPLGRLHALCTLDGLQAASPELILVALGDSHPGVRRQAVRIAESRFPSSLPLAEQVGRMVNDPDAIVRLQVAYSLGEWNSVAAGDSLAALALHPSADETVVAAVMSSVHAANLNSLVASILRSENPPAEILQPLLMTAVGLREKQVTNQIVSDTLQRASKLPLRERFRIATALLKSLEQRRSIAETLLAPETSRRFAELAEHARRTAHDESAELSERVLAVGTLASPWSATHGDAGRLAALLTLPHPPELQAAALAVLASQHARELAPLTLQDWRSHSPSLRSLILDSLLSRQASTSAFLTAVEQGGIPTAHIDARRRQQLLTHADGEIRKRAASLFASESLTSRSQLVEQYLRITEMPTDPVRGKAVFGKRCAVCHHLEGAGQNVGPDLTALTDKSPRALLIAILDPNKAVEDKFLDYLAITADGRQVSGMLTHETSTSVTLVGQEAKRITLRRNDLESLQSSGKSLMPEGMEKDLSHQDLADLIGYVRSVATPPKRFPGNHPELAHIRDDGSIRLLAMHARIYGPRIVFEEQYRNLGYWQSPDDFAVWTLQVPKAGKYQVRLDYACDDRSAGDRFVISVGDQTLGGVVTGTGSWDRYRGQSVGTMELPAGSQELLIRSDGPIRSALMDLRQIILEPR